MNAPLVSVIMPCFNDGKYIKEAIDSVERAPKELFEIIIIDDGSTDDYTKKKLMQYGKRGYTVLRQRNTGPCAARNAGIKIAKGEYILPVDADNMINPEYMVRGVEILGKNKKVGVVYGDCIHFSPGFEERRRVGVFDKDKMALANYIDTCAVIRKKLLMECGGYDEKLFGWEDWELWINAYQKGWKFHYIPEIMFYYRLKPNSLSIRCGEPGVLEKIRDHVRQKHMKFFFENV